MARWWIWTLGAACGGCGLFGDPGTLVGEMTVHATLQSNTCGAAVPASDASDTHVKLYERDGVLTWSGSEGSFQATIDTAGDFVFQSTSSQLLRADEPDGEGGVRAACVVDAIEEIRGTLVRRSTSSADGGDGGDGEAAADGADAAGDDDGGTTAASVTATDTLRVAPAAGADCTDFVGLGTGLFQALPCSVIVELQGDE